MKKRKGFTMLELIACTVMLALIVMGVTAASMVIDTLRTNTRSTVSLSLQNLNCIEMLRQECLKNGLLKPSYTDEELGSQDVHTVATVKEYNWNQFRLFEVTVRSRVREGRARLTAKCVITTIGGMEPSSIVGAT